MASVPETSGDKLERPPAGATLTGILPNLGAPTHRWCYRDAHGDLFWQCRYLAKGDPAEGTEDHKEYRPWVWSARKLAWVARAPPQPRPLFHLDALQARPTVPVVIVEGEKCAEALQTLRPEEVVSCWLQGAAGAKYADWSPLQGRTVTLWPDNDNPGFDAMSWIAGHLFSLGAAVRIVNVPRETYPKGWDCADAIASGWSAEQIEAFITTHVMAVTAPAANVVSLQSRRIARATLEPEPAAAPAVWRAWGLDLSHKGLPYENTDNVCRVLAHFREEGGSFGEVWYDEFAQRIMTQTLRGARAWEEPDTIALQCYLQAHVHMKHLSKAFVHDAVCHAARQRTVNPVRQWLLDLPPWDGELRLENMLCEGWGAVRNDYTAAVGRCFVMGAVARIMEPGCQVDMLPVFEGGQGIGKTTALRDLFSRRWHTEPTYRMGDKDFYLALSSKWCVELSELAAFKGASAELVNSVVTRVEDYFRVPYERMPSAHPRMCVFAGTTNADDWNHFEYGDRRYLPVQCAQIDNAWIRTHREALFAEALHRYRAGEVWHDVPFLQACQEREERRAQDSWRDHIERFLRRATFTTVAELLRYPLEIPVDKWTPAVQDRLVRVLRELHWLRTRTRDADGHQVRGWRCPPGWPPTPKA
jgi:putative DNA primase/helicase